MKHILALMGIIMLIIYMMNPVIGLPLMPLWLAMCFIDERKGETRPK